jgi:hypothetical protein
MLCAHQILNLEFPSSFISLIIFDNSFPISLLLVEMASFAPIHPGVNIQIPAGFQGPGLYHIKPYGPGKDSTLQAVGVDDARFLGISLQEATQRWVVEQWGDNRFKLFVDALALSPRICALEAFPRDELAKPRPPKSDQDQLWIIENVENNPNGLVRVSCETKSRGLIYLEANNDMVTLKNLDALSPNQLFVFERLDQRTLKLGFPGPGKYQISSLAPHAMGKVLEAFPKHDQIRARDPPGSGAAENIDQHWNFEDQGDFFRITCYTAKNQDVAMEAFPREHSVHPRPSKQTEPDQWWQITELGDGKTIKISCKTKSRGLVCLELPEGSHLTVSPPSSSLNQNFQVIPLFEPPKAFSGAGIYKIVNARCGLSLEAFPQQQVIKVMQTSHAMDQLWRIEKVAVSAEDGDMFKIQCNTKNCGLVSWESYPRDDVVRPVPSVAGKYDQDLIWYVEELGDSIHVKFYCYSKSRGKVYLEVPLGFPHVTVRGQSENPGQLFRLERVGCLE